MEGLDLLGAGDAWADQYITFRVKNIDKAKLQLALGGYKGTVASSAISIVDTAPKAVIDLVSPILKNTAKDYGVDVDITVSNALPAKPRAMSEFWPGLVVGSALLGVGFGLTKLVMGLVRK